MIIVHHCDELIQNVKGQNAKHKDDVRQDDVVRENNREGGE